MRYGSVCSGIESATVAWHQLGWQPAWFSEIEKFPSQVLAHHYPEVKNLGDMTCIAKKIKSGEVDAPNILVGGTPCQAFSVAGLRGSLDDSRGQLTLEFVRIANEIDSARLVRGQHPSIIVWENVPGVLNTKDNAFGCFLGAISGSGCELKPSGRKWTNAGCVSGPQRQVTWRVLDAQYFGLAQRRKRVFVIASARTECDLGILFERKGVFRDSPKGGKTREDTTTNGQNDIGSTGKTINKVYCGTANDYLRDLTLEKSPTLRSGGDGGAIRSAVFGVGGMTTNASIMEDKFPTLLARTEADGYVCEQFTYGIQGNIIGRSEKSGGNGLGFKVEKAPTLTATDRHGVAYSIIADTTPKTAREINGTLRSSGGGGGGGGIVPPSVTHMSRARYLTEIEAERLQGFPDNYTNIPGASKGARYKAIGNSMAVPVMLWIGQQIQAVFKYSDSEVV